MSPPFPNIYSHRKVAETSAKSCDVCYRLSSSVLITTDNKDRGFCSAIVDKEAEQARKKNKVMDEEVARLKEEYEARKKKKADEGANKGKGKEKENAQDKDKDDEKDNGKDESKGQENDESPKNKDGETNDKQDASASTEPRMFALHRTFYQLRVEKKRQAELAKKNMQRLQDPSFFPKVPSGPPGGA